MSSSSVVRNGVDVWVGEGAPDRNNSGTVQLHVGNDGPGGNEAYTFFYFHNPAPRGSTIIHAWLRFYTADDWGAAAREINIRRVIAPSTAGPAWTVRWRHVTWNNQPPTGAIVVSHSQHAGAAATLWEIDVARFVQMYANGQPNFGLRLAAPDMDTRHAIWSLNSTHHKPTLEVEWSDAPASPTNLVPSGGQVISAGQPVLQWDYTDFGAGSAMSALQVQIAGAAGTPPVWDGPGTNVHWDSGVTPADQPELDLAQTSHSPFNDGITRFWRVRHRDAAGLWSRWSARNGAGAEFTRHAQGTLTLTSPGTDGTVDDFSPPIAWHFVPPAGAAQTHWQVILTAQDDHTQVIFNSGKRRGADDATTIPDGYIRHTGRHYHLIVRVWDDYDRTATPGHPIFVSVQRNFTVGTHPHTPARNLRGTIDPDGRPFITFTWQRDDAPDYWNIRRGTELVQHIPGTDLLTATPGNYRWVEKDANPNTRHTWTVEAVVNGQRSANNPQWSGQVSTFHAWLIDRDATPDQLVAILDPDVSFEEPDTSATYEPVNANRVIRVIQQHRGMQGTVSGRIIGTQYWTLADHRDNFLAMKAKSAAHPNQTFRLSAGNRSWRVLLGDMITSPMRMPDSMAEQVSFSFWSVDGPEGAP